MFITFLSCKKVYISKRGIKVAQQDGVRVFGELSLTFNMTFCHLFSHKGENYETIKKKDKAGCRYTDFQSFREFKRMHSTF